MYFFKSASSFFKSATILLYEPGLILILKLQGFTLSPQVALNILGSYDLLLSCVIVKIEPTGLLQLIHLGFNFLYSTRFSFQLKSLFLIIDFLSFSNKLSYFDFSL